MLEIVISDLALLDIDYMLQFSIETFGDIQTKKYLKLIYEKISQLSAHPEIGHQHKLLSNALRIINVEKHVILYQVLEQEKVIQIIRIVHQKVNISDVFES
jgi:toxin ParE1/3/4